MGKKKHKLSKLSEVMASGLGIAVGGTVGGLSGPAGAYTGPAAGEATRRWAKKRLKEIEDHHREYGNDPDETAIGQWARLEYGAGH